MFYLNVFTLITAILFSIAKTAVAADSYAIISEKNLFRPDRKEWVIEKTDSKMLDKKIDTSKLELFGTIIIGDKKSALIFDKQTNLKNKKKKRMRHIPQPRKGVVRYVAPEAVTIECTGKGFQPDSIRVESGQSLLFMIEEPRSRIEIQLEEPDDRPGKARQRKVRRRTRWSKSMDPMSIRKLSNRGTTIEGESDRHAVKIAG